MPLALQLFFGLKGVLNYAIIAICLGELMMESLRIRKLIIRNTFSNFQHETVVIIIYKVHLELNANFELVYIHSTCGRVAFNGLQLNGLAKSLDCATLDSVLRGGLTEVCTARRNRGFIWIRKYSQGRRPSVRRGKFHMRTYDEKDI